MLRWYDKTGGVHELAKSARKRQHGLPVGKVYYNNQLKINE
jgi:hypothetical protein